MNLKPILVFSFLFAVLFSCEKKDPIVGKWKLDGVDIEKALAIFPDNQREFVKNIMTSAFDGVKGKMKMDINQDGKFRFEAPVPDGRINVENGTWSISKDRKKLFTYIEGKKEAIQILELTETRLVLNMHADGRGEMEMTFVHR